MGRSQTGSYGKSHLHSIPGKSGVVKMTKQSLGTVFAATMMLLATANTLAQDDWEAEQLGDAYKDSEESGGVSAPGDEGLVSLTRNIMVTRVFRSM